MKALLLFLLVSFCANAGMYFPKDYVKNPIERPGEHNFANESDCEAHYKLDCLELPDNYNQEIYDYNEIAGFRVNQQKKELYEQKKTQKDLQVKQEKEDKQALKQKLKSGQELTPEESKKLLLMLIDK